MIKSKNFVIETVIYPFDVLISYGETEAQLAKNLKMYGAKANVKELLGDNTTAARTTMLDSGQTIITFNPKKFKKEFHNYVAHEVFHAVTFIMDRVGMKLEVMVSCEAYAYLIGYLVGEIHKQIK